MEAQPCHAIKNGFYSLRGGTFKVGVFNSENEAALMVTGKGPTVERGAGATNMKKASWAWGKAGAHGS